MAVKKIFRTTLKKLFCLIKQIRTTCNQPRMEWFQRYYQIFIQSGRSEGWDTLSAMENIDKMVESWKKTGIRFSADATFLCSNYGLIMSTALPGAHFSDTLGGKWLQKSDTLILSFGTEPYYFQWKYIVVPTPKHELRLQEMIRGNELSGTEFIFISEK